MGLGKSCQAITACDLVKAQNVLVLCPAVVRYNWAREIGLWSSTPRTPLVVTSGRGLPPTPAHTTICSYALVEKLNPWLRSVRWDAVVLDEAHYLKAPDAKRTAAVFGGSGVAREAARVWALTGTPAPNHAAELWVLLRCFGAYEGDYDSFVRAFCNTYQDGYATRIAGTRLSAIPRLQALLRTVMKRRKKDEVALQLPPITYGGVEVAAGTVDMELYFTEHFMAGHNGAAEVMAKIGDERRAMLTADAEFLEAMKGVTSSYRRYVGLQKMGPVADLVAGELDVEAYEKVVIFAVHRDVVMGLRERLKDYDVVTVFGGTDPEQREKNIRRFQENPRCRVFIGNVQAAGVGVNLTAASQVIVAEPDWVPANNAQAIMRCHRIGQTRPVSVRFVSLAGDELDQRIQRTLRRKVRELTEVLDVLVTPQAREFR